ncbi:hypothetical protein PRIPAC_78866 [Pristionchus pacificus]|uniref:G protein-coupled receptor n=1 Tax=Pristionchus pacificus TaxID=54126 RepID=A0A2A6C2D0_PRIPA|nr:hypothetical protein PRIPAC_78866 [Pristionchus pacificus]|eukprot:PDM72269.1 G protein-coupled receptor [Pristionchus pacificus]
MKRITITIMNNSYWIVFFVQRDIIPQPIQAYFVVLNTIEVLAKLIGDILSVIVGTFGIYVFYKVQYFHFNLAVIWVNSFLIGIFFVISRYVLIPFEYGICALYLASTYEKVPRRFFSAIIITANYVISSMLGYLVVHKIVHGFYYLVFVCVAGNISYMTFLYLNRAGKRQQKKLLEKYRGYSVSFRWQLQQNIASAEQLSILMIIVNIATSVILPSIFVPAIILENDEIAKLFMQLMISLSVCLVIRSRCKCNPRSFALVYGIFLIAVSKHREWMCGKKTVTDGDRYQQRIEKMSVDAHLSRLEETWNAKRFALHFVTTYERIRRRYISVRFFMVSITSHTFLYMNRAGKRQQKELLEQYKGYSVSYRWQLEQNISAAQQLSILMIIVNVAILFYSSVVFPLACSTVLLAIAKHRQWLFGKHKTSEDQRRQKRIEKLTIDAHLSQLEDAWNAKFDNKRNS